MYCPVCYNNTVSLSARGVVNIIVNGMQRDSGRFLYNLSKEGPKEIRKHFHQKLDEFFSWYADFQNREPINKVELTSADVSCENGCQLPLTSKFSVVDVLISKKTILEELKAISEKYKIPLDVEI